MDLIFTDLDGTLLDSEMYSWSAAAPVLQALEARGVPLVLVTSKTRAEVLALRDAMGHEGAFVVENGAAVYGAYARTFAATYAEVRRGLQKAARREGLQVRGFGDMSVVEVAELTGLSMQAAELAKQREFAEPYLVEGDADRLQQVLVNDGYDVTRGGRFWHVSKGADKGAAVQYLIEQWQPTRSIALGDAPNDASMLLSVDVPVVIPGHRSDDLLRLVPRARVAPQAGPSGWAAVIRELIEIKE